MSISQAKASDEILMRFGMENSKAVSTPCDTQVILGVDGKDTDTTKYRSMIGSLFHLVNCTRPDLSYAVSYASRYQVNPKSTEVTAVKRILQYLNKTKSEGLVYKKSGNDKFIIEVFVDASYAPQGEKSTSGWVIYVNGNLVSWKSLKQSITAKSSAESEYVALSQAISDALFIRAILIELNLDVETPIEVYEDNQAAIQIANNPVYKSKIKQVNVHYHFIRDYVKMGVINITHIQSKDQVADAFTKPLNGPLFQIFKEKLNLGVSISEGSVEA